MIVLKSLSNQAHIAIICEGQPLHLELSDKEAQRFQLDRLETPMPLSVALKIVGDAFDYDVATAKGTAAPSYYLLTKRYTDPEELPFVTFDEVQHSLEGIILTTKRFSPPYGSTYPLRKLWRSLNDQQREQFAKGILVRQVPTEQQEDALQIIGGLQYINVPLLANIVHRLQGCRRPDTVFKWQTMMGMHIPVYAGLFGPTKDIWYVALNRWNYTTTGGVTGFIGAQEVKFKDNSHVVHGRNFSDVINEDQEPTTPRPADKIRHPAPVMTRTLQSIVEETNRRLSKEEGTVTTAQVAAEVAEKPIILTGSEYISPVDVIRGIGDVYGLPVRISTERKTVRIILPVAHVASDPNDIPIEVERLLPRNFARAAKNANQRAIESGLRPWQASLLMFTKAMRRLRELIEPQLKQRINDELPVTEVGREEHDLIALTSLLTCIDDLTIIGGPAPDTLTHFAESRIQLFPETKDATQFRMKVFAPFKGEEGLALESVITFPPTDKPGYLK